MLEARVLAPARDRASALLRVECVFCRRRRRLMFRLPFGARTEAHRLTQAEVIL